MSQNYFNLNKNIHCSEKELVKRSKYQYADLGFLPYLSRYFLHLVDAFKNHRDSNYIVKTVYSHNDLLIGNYADRVLYFLVSPQLTKEYYSRESTKTYRKYERFITNLRRLLGDSLIFSEIEMWKLKRKEISSFFTFNKIKNSHQTILGIVNRNLAKVKSGSELRLNLLDFGTECTSQVTITLFFGGGNINVDQLEIEGEKLNLFICSLHEDLGKQNRSTVNRLLGPHSLKWGLTALDRRVSKRLSKFMEYSKYFVRNRIAEIEKAN